VSGLARSVSQGGSAGCCKKRAAAPLSGRGGPSPPPPPPSPSPSSPSSTSSASRFQARQPSGHAGNT